MIKFNVYQTKRQPDGSLSFELYATYDDYDTAHRVADKHPSMGAIPFDDEEFSSDVELNELWDADPDEED